MTNSSNIFNPKNVAGSGPSLCRPLELPVATYSIVALDPANGDLGIAVQSKFLAVGAVVPWAEAGVGAVATQSFPDPSYGPKGLAKLAAGASPAEALEELTAADEGRAVRQVGIVDAKGRSASYTGADCLGWAGQVIGENFAAQGNMLVNKATVANMADEFQKSTGELTDRLMSALSAAQHAGGDARGKQSAAILVVRKGAGFLGLSDKYFDLRVDDHPNPIEELKRILELQRTLHLCVDSSRMAAEGNVDQAVRVIETARDREPENVNVLYFLARTYAIAGREADAKAALARAQAVHANIALLARGDKLLASIIGD